MHSFAWLTTCWTDLIPASESCLPSLVTKPTGAVCLIFVAAFATLAIYFWPYMIPFSLKIESSLRVSATRHHRLQLDLS
jgi:hypothetical protein